MSNLRGNPFLNKLRLWFFQAKESTSADTDRLWELPEPLTDELEGKIDELPVPAPYRTQTCETISERVKAWQNNPTESNSLAILANPVEPLARIIKDALQDWQTEEINVVTLLDRGTRPDDPMVLVRNLEDALKAQNVAIDRSADRVVESQEEAWKQRHTVLVIPNLAQSFLRCIRGWQSIELLRDTIVRDRSFFWIVGCNYWSWQFLNYVCHISAYLDRIFDLPPLDAAALREWLTPVEKAIANPKDAAESPTFITTETDWEGLAREARGSSEIAAHLWLRSLRMFAEKEDREAGDSPMERLRQPTAARNEHRPPDDAPIYRLPPKLPSLPYLETIDRYLLHALLIHDRISLPHLALSFGEPESLIRPRVQILLQREIVYQRKNLLAVCPAYYLKIKTELENNNFFAGKA